MHLHAVYSLVPQQIGAWIIVTLRTRDNANAVPCVGQKKSQIGKHLACGRMIRIKVAVDENDSQLASQFWLLSIHRCVQRSSPRALANPSWSAKNNSRPLWDCKRQV